jgi:hypothetical protein
MLDYGQHLADMPRSISLGYSSVSICRPSELERHQVGYSIDLEGNALSGEGDGDWRRNWLVIGDEGQCGDPIFIDTAVPGYPVYTAWHGEGRWDPRPIAVSLTGLREALRAVSKAARSREHPVALQQNPISPAERTAVLAEIQRQNPGINLFFWALMMGDDLEDPRTSAPQAVME